MCRSGIHARRCRHQHSLEQRRAASARQRMSRYARACDAAMDRGDLAAAEKHEALMNKALADLGVTVTPPVRTAPSSAATYTAESTAAWTDADFEEALAKSWDDPEAVSQLMGLLDERDAGAAPDPATVASHDLATSAWHDSWAESTPMTSTAWRPSRKLTPNQRARAEYDSYVDVQYLQAESECNGVLLTKEGYAKGIDPRSLFSGNHTRAVKYASPELQSWWQKNGRMSFSAYRYHTLGWDSDRQAAEYDRIQTYDAPAW